MATELSNPERVDLAVNNATTLDGAEMLPGDKTISEPEEDWQRETPVIQAEIKTDNLYQLGAGDVISFSLYGIDALNQEKITVRMDGMATFKGVGDLQVTGRTIPEVQAMLEERLAYLYLDPIVTVSIVETKPGIVYLSGAVKKPGMFEISTKSTLPTDERLSRSVLRISNILSQAGGVLATADLSNVQVRNADFRFMRRVDLWKMLKEGDLSQDLLLQSGDQIYIPELSYLALSDEDYSLLLRSSIGPQSFPVRMLGYVNNPGLVELDGNSPYLSSAIAKASGYKEGARKRVVKIKRLIGQGQLTSFNINPDSFDLALWPNDIIEVREVGLAKASETGKLAANMLSPFASIFSSLFALTFIAGFR